MKAYTAVEELSGEYSGTVVYADSNVEARRIAAGELTDGEFGGLRVRREPSLDVYQGKPIPMAEMIWMGWWTDCTNCGVRVNSEMYEDEEEYENKTPCGTFFGAGFCSDECKKEWQSKKEREPLIKYRMFQKLKGIAEQYVLDPIFVDDNSHCWINWNGEEPKVSSANIAVTVKGAPKHDQFSVKYNLKGDGTATTMLHLPYTDAGKAAFRPHATQALDILMNSQ